MLLKGSSVRFRSLRMAKAMHSQSPNALSDAWYRKHTPGAPARKSQLCSPRVEKETQLRSSDNEFLCRIQGRVPSLNLFGKTMFVVNAKVGLFGPIQVHLAPNQARLFEQLCAVSNSNSLLVLPGCSWSLL